MTRPIPRILPGSRSSTRSRRLSSASSLPIRRQDRDREAQPLAVLVDATIVDARLADLEGADAGRDLALGHVTVTHDQAMALRPGTSSRLRVGVEHAREGFRRSHDWSGGRERPPHARPGRYAHAVSGARGDASRTSRCGSDLDDSAPQGDGIVGPSVSTWLRQPSIRSLVWRAEG